LNLLAGILRRTSCLRVINATCEDYMSYEKLRTVQNRFEGELLAAALERGGVDFFLRTFEDTAYDGLFVTQEGWGVIWVAPEDRQLAEEIIQTFDVAYAPGIEEESEPP
jgi:hypothetical protein